MVVDISGVNSQVNGDYIISRMYDRRFTVVEVAGGDMRPVKQ